MSKKIDKCELEKINNLLDEGLIDDDEYRLKISKLLEIDKDIHQNEESKKIKESGKSSKIIAIGMAFLLIMVGFLVFDDEALVNSDNNIDNTEIVSDDIYAQATWALKDFYLDNAVVVVNGGDNYYHRYRCPDYLNQVGNQYTFWVYNKEAAADRGYSQCPTCFSVDQDTYILNNLNF